MGIQWWWYDEGSDQWCVARDSLELQHMMSFKNRPQMDFWFLMSSHFSSKKRLVKGVIIICSCRKTIGKLHVDFLLSPFTYDKTELWETKKWVVLWRSKFSSLGWEERGDVNWVWVLLKKISERWEHIWCRVCFDFYTFSINN